MTASPADEPWLGRIIQLTQLLKLLLSITRITSMIASPSSHVRKSTQRLR
jgi:hypothetical protein